MQRPRLLDVVPRWLASLVDSVLLILNQKYICSRMVCAECPIGEGLEVRKVETRRDSSAAAPSIRALSDGAVRPFEKKMDHVISRDSFAMLDDRVMRARLHNWAPIILLIDVDDDGKVFVVTKTEQRPLKDVHQAVTNSIGSEFGCVMDVQHLHDIGAVNADGVDADIELSRNFFI